MNRVAGSEKGKHEGATNDGRRAVRNWTFMEGKSKISQPGDKNQQSEEINTQSRS